MVAIKDFGMPSCCAKCPCAKYEEVRWMEYKFIGCGVALSKPDGSKNAFWGRESRLKDCPLVEAIPKDQYETRLKADLEAILVELQLEIEEKYPKCDLCEYVVDYDYEENDISEYSFVGSVTDITDMIQKKINALKEG